MAELEQGYPLDYRQSGDTLDDFARKYISEMKQIYQYLNNIRVHSTTGTSHVAPEPYQFIADGDILYAYDSSGTKVELGKFEPNFGLVSNNLGAFLGGTLASRPTSASEGDLYFSTDDTTVYRYTNDAWTLYLSTDITKLDGYDNLITEDDVTTPTNTSTIYTTAQTIPRTNANGVLPYNISGSTSKVAGINVETSDVQDGQVLTYRSSSNSWKAEDLPSLSISVNGETQEATDSVVSITIPTDNKELTNGAGYATTSSVTTAINVAKLEMEDALDEKLVSVYKIKGSCAFANLPGAQESTEGYIYNITDAFTTTASFVEGEGYSYPAGTNVVVVDNGDSTYSYDVLGGLSIPDDVLRSISIGTVTTTEAGTTATVTNSGTATAAVLDFTIPKGDTGAQGEKGEKGDTGATGTKGDKGDKGDTGTAATIKVGTVTSGTTASVTNSGTTSAAVLNFVLPKGDKGDTGDKGDAGTAGTAATIAIGTVTTGAAGTSASVTNSGTSTAAVLDFVIPKGDKGDTGASGSGSSSGSSDYTLPVATTSTLGGVKASSTLTVASDGTASVASAPKLTTARAMQITDSSATYVGLQTSFDGSLGINLRMPSTFAGTLKGNSDTATKLQTARTITLETETEDELSSASFDGSGNVYLTLPSTLAVSITGKAAKATADGNGNTISTTYAKAANVYTKTDCDAAIATAIAAITDGDEVSY